MRARVRLPDELSRLLRPEVEEAIRKANLGLEDTEIAKRYLIDRVPQIDIACEIGVERSTISRRMPRILEQTVCAARKINH